MFIRVPFINVKTTKRKKLQIKLAKVLKIYPITTAQIFSITLEDQTVCDITKILFTNIKTV